MRTVKNDSNNNAAAVRVFFHAVVTRPAAVCYHPRNKINPRLAFDTSGHKFSVLVTKVNIYPIEKETWCMYTSHTISYASDKKVNHRRQRTS